jgi:hypothetical protein
MAVPTALARPDPPKFPEPPKSRTLRLPGGGSLTAVADFPRSLPDQCQVSMRMLLQLGPFLGAMECVIRILKFCEWLIDFVKAVPSVPTNPTKIIKLLGKLPPIAKDLLGCITAWTPVGYCAFIKDVLVMIIDFLRCVVELLKSIATQKLEIAVSMGDAQGNPELLEALQLAQDNADKMGLHAVNSCGPVFALLGTVGSFMSALGVGAIKVPSIDDLTGGDAAAALQPLEDLVDTLSAIADALPC